MQRSFVINAKLLAWAAVALVAVALSIPTAMAYVSRSDRTAAAVITIEHKWLAALHRRDVQTLKHILGREFIDSDFQGETITRAQYLNLFRTPELHSEPPVRQTFADTLVRFVADGKVAVVTGIVITRPLATSNARSSSNPTRYSRFTDVFVWRDARWQAVTGQETHFAAVTR